MADPTLNAEIQQLQQAFAQSAIAAVLDKKNYNADNSTFFKILFAKNIQDILYNYSSNRSVDEDSIKKILYILSKNIPESEQQDINISDLNNFWDKLNTQITTIQPFEFLSGAQIAELPLFRDLSIKHVQEIILKANNHNGKYQEFQQNMPSAQLQQFVANIWENWSPNKIAKLYSYKPDFPNNLVLLDLLTNREPSEDQYNKTKSILTALLKQANSKSDRNTAIVDITEYLVPNSKSCSKRLNPRLRDDLLLLLLNILLENNKTVKLNAPKIKSANIANYLDKILEAYGSDESNLEINSAQTLLQEISNTILRKANAVDIVSKLNFNSIKKLSTSINDQSKQLNLINTIVDAITLATLDNNQRKEINDIILGKLLTTQDHNTNKKILKKLIYAERNSSNNTAIESIFEIVKEQDNLNNAINLLAPLTDILLKNQRSTPEKRLEIDPKLNIDTIISLYNEEKDIDNLNIIAKKILLHLDSATIVSKLNTSSIVAISKFAYDVKTMHIVANAVRSNKDKFVKNHWEQLNTNFSTNLPEAVKPIPTIYNRPKKSKFKSPTTWWPNLAWYTKDVWRKNKNIYRSVIKKQPNFNTLLAAITNAGIKVTATDPIIDKIDADGQKYLPFIRRAPESIHIETAKPMSTPDTKPTFKLIQQESEPDRIHIENLSHRTSSPEQTTTSDRTTPDRKSALNCGRVSINPELSQRFLHKLRRKNFFSDLTSNSISIKSSTLEQQSEDLCLLIRILARINHNSTITLYDFDENTLKLTFNKLRRGLNLVKKPEEQENYDNYLLHLINTLQYGNAPENTKSTTTWNPQQELARLKNDLATQHSLPLQPLSTAAAAKKRQSPHTQ